MIGLVNKEIAIILKEIATTDKEISITNKIFEVVRMCRGQTKHTESKDEYFASHSVYHFKLE
uniref:Uncharacterized protein n=1 Tax=Rhizophagus irregularis (strain DAOM 181602 / DAOM 197198 / MUCL 43194) TaxID=747089 RepID=U9TFI5_RHIID